MAIKEISSQSAIDHKEKTHNTHVYSEFVLSFICIYLNMAIGSSKINFSDIVHYVTGHTDTKATFLLHNVRMPRMIAGLFIGGALAVSGLLMQAMTRNPLASPKILVSVLVHLFHCICDDYHSIIRILCIIFRCDRCIYRWFNCLYTFRCYERYDTH